jgi:uncharacterized protein YukE
MPILSELSVTEVQDLISESNAFQTRADDLKRTTDAMFSVVDESSSVWGGQDREAFVNKFNGLHDSVEMIYQMVIDYHDRLQRIASNYGTMLDQNSTVVNGLKPSIDFQ